MIAFTTFRLLRLREPNNHRAGTAVVGTCTSIDAEVEGACIRSIARETATGEP